MTAPVVTKKDLTAAQAASAIAAEIREKGHYRSNDSDHGVCLVSNSTFFELSRVTQDALTDAVLDRVKETTGWDLVQKSHPLSSSRLKMVYWNDHSPTPRVLEVLDSIAASDGA